MGIQVAKQPNSDKYAIFNTVIDMFVAIDATREEVIEYFVAEASKHERESITRLMDHLDEHSRDQFAKRWDQLIEIDKKSGGTGWQLLETSTKKTNL